MGHFTEMVTTIALAIISVAIVAVLVSKNSNTTGVIQASGSAFGNSLAVAEAPVTGSSLNINLAYPTSSGIGFGSIGGGGGAFG